MIKKKIKLFLSNSPSLLRHMQYIFNLLFHRNRLMKLVSYGSENNKKIIFVIRPNSEDGIQGLMSIFIQCMRWIDYALKNEYVPYIDLLNYKTQYYDGITNAWDYYFEQSLEYKEIMKSKNVILSGSTWNENVNNELFRDAIFKNEELSKYCFNLIWNNIRLSEETANLLSSEEKRLNISKCLGVYIRGTDYVSLKPTGEYVQPDIVDVIEKIKEFLQKYNVKIFLVTEDASYYKKIKKAFGDRVLLTSYDSFIDNYTGKDYLSKSNVLGDNKKRRGLEYLVKILLLSKCKYLISSITMGSLAAYSFNGGQYEDKYIFELGYYQ